MQNVVTCAGNLPQALCSTFLGCPIVLMHLERTCKNAAAPRMHPLHQLLKQASAKTAHYTQASKLNLLGHKMFNHWLVKSPPGIPETGLTLTKLPFFLAASACWAWAAAAASRAFSSSVSSSGRPSFRRRSFLSSSASAHAQHYLYGKHPQLTLVCSGNWQPAHVLSTKTQGFDKGKQAGMQRDKMANEEAVKIWPRSWLLATACTDKACK